MKIKNSTLIDYSNLQIGPIFVIKRVENINSKIVIWQCRCDCGKIFNISAGNIRKWIKRTSTGNIYVHGCKKQRSFYKKNLDYIGQKYNRLLIVELIKCEGKAKVKCKCDCGNNIICNLNALKRNNTKSCGCWNKEHASQIGILYGSKNCSRRHAGWFYIKDGQKIIMRSSLEVMFAEILDNKGVEWQYEPKVFKLKEDMRYIPDFYVPSEDVWYEIKGYMKERSQIKINEFINQGYNLKIILQKDIEKEHPLSYYKFMKNFKNRNN